VRFQFIADYMSNMRDISSGSHSSVVRLCNVLRVSRAGYYAWSARNRAGYMSTRARQDISLTWRIRTVYEMSRATYGSPRIYADLKAQGIFCGRGRVERLMRVAGLKAITRRRWRVRTTDSSHPYQVAPNVLGRRFDEVTRPNTVWAADITYIPTAEGWLYLAAVVDVASRRVVGWSIKPTLKRDIALDALGMAVTHRGTRSVPQSVLHHSDRGVQYACEDYRMLLEQCGLTASMSRKGDCYDNAVVESFFASLKTELVYRPEWKSQSATWDGAKSALFSYIELWYNRRRRHSSLGYLSPADFEDSLMTKAA
jgi:putative transposase